MNYRKLGKTDLHVSEIGFGCTHLPTVDENELKRMFDVGIDAGMNILDVCLAEPEVRDKIGRSIEGRRNKLIIQGHVGMTLEDGQYARTQNFEKSVQHLDDFYTRLKTDYIDIAMLHCIDQIEEYEAAINSGLIDYMLEQKKKGVFKYLGFSSHEPETASHMVNSSHFDVVMFSISPLFDLLFHDMDKFFTMAEDEPYPTSIDIDEKRAALYALCEEKNVGITVMKALAAGGLVDPAGSPFAKAMTVPQCIHYALNRPAVGSVLIGFKDTSQVNAALSYYGAAPEELDYSYILNSITGGVAKRCLYCNHCLPCSSHINIGAITKLLDTGTIHGKTKELRDEYERLQVKASDCTECRLCVSRCPFGIDIMGNMKKAGAMFEG